MGRPRMGAGWEEAGLRPNGTQSREGEAREPPGSDRPPGPQCQWAPARGTGLHLRASSTPRTFRMSTGRTGTAAGLLARQVQPWSSPSASSSWRTRATGWSCATPPLAVCSAPSTAPSHRRRGRCVCAPPRCCSPSTATHAAMHRALRSPTAVSPSRVPTSPDPPPPCLTPLSAGLQDAPEDRAPPKGSAQTPAAFPEGTNVSCSPRPGAPEAAMGGEAGIRGEREFGERTLPNPVLTAPVFPQPGSSQW